MSRSYKDQRPPVKVAAAMNQVLSHALTWATGSHAELILRQAHGEVKSAASRALGHFRFLTHL